MAFLKKSLAYFKEIIDINFYGLNLYDFKVLENYIKNKLELLEKEALIFCMERDIPVEYFYRENDFSYAGRIQYTKKASSYDFMSIRLNTYFYKNFLNEKERKVLGQYYSYSRLVKTLYHEIGHYIGICSFDDSSEKRANYEGAKLASNFISELDMVILNTYSNFFTSEKNGEYLKQIQRNPKKFKELKSLIKSYT